MKSKSKNKKQKHLTKHLLDLPATIGISANLSSLGGQCNISGINVTITKPPLAAWRRIRSKGEITKTRPDTRPILFSWANHQLTQAARLILMKLTVLSMISSGMFEVWLHRAHGFVWVNTTGAWLTDRACLLVSADACARSTIIPKRFSSNTTS